MKWFRHYHGLVTDPKLHRIAGELSVRRHVVAMAWCAVLEYGSDNSADRGSIAGLSAKTLAYMTDCSQAKAAGCLAAFRAAGMIDGDKIRAFSERNYETDDAYKRVVRHRQRRNSIEFRSKNDQDPTQSEANPNENKIPNALENNETRENETFLVTVDETSQRQSKKERKKENPFVGFPLPLTVPAGKPAARTKRALPDDFPLTPERKAAAERHGINGSCREEFDHFLAHHRAHGTTMKNWDQAWVTWCMKSKQFKARAGPQQSRRSPVADVLALMAKDEER